VSPSPKVKSDHHFKFQTGKIRLAAVLASDRDQSDVTREWGSVVGESDTHPDTTLRTYYSYYTHTVKLFFGFSHREHELRLLRSSRTFLRSFESGFESCASLLWNNSFVPCTSLLWNNSFVPVTSFNPIVTVTRRPSTSST
jgi:hypothetical protein